MIKRIRWQKTRQDMWRGLSQFNLGHKYANLIDAFADRNKQKIFNRINNKNDKQNDNQENNQSNNKDNDHNNGNNDNYNNQNGKMVSLKDRAMSSYKSTPKLQPLGNINGNTYANSNFNSNSSSNININNNTNINFNIIDFEKERLIQQNNQMKEHIQILNMRIYQIQSSHNQISQIKANFHREISRLNKVNRHMMETIAESTKLIQIYKDQLGIVAENCKLFQKTLKLKYNRQQIANAFCKRVSSQILTFQSVQNSDYLLGKISNLVDQYPLEYKNQFIQEQIKTIKSFKSISGITSTKNLKNGTMINSNHSGYNQSQNVQQQNQFQKQSKSKSKIYDLQLTSSLINLKIQPDRDFIDRQQYRIKQAIKNIKMEFDNQLHLLQSRKMNYRQIKNKKLLRPQAFECRNCDIYEEIVSQIFKIVKQYSARIKHRLYDIYQDQHRQVESIL